MKNVFLIFFIFFSVNANTAQKNLNLKTDRSRFNFWVNYFSKSTVNKKRFNRFLVNGDKYKGLVKEIFRKHGLPEDLYYVGLIESGYNLKIRSRASAVGPWQFIRGTAIRYGVRVDSHVDERINIIKSTKAAAKYFKDLYGIFNRWDLALAGYNAGEFRILNAIKKGKTRSFIKLVRKRLLPRETAYYVSKVNAARHLDKNRKKYGFSGGKSDKSFKNLSLVPIRKSFSLRQVSKKLGIGYQFLRKINKDIKRNRVLVKTKEHKLLIPSFYKKKFFKLKYHLGKLKKIKQRRWHTVERGENLVAIASIHGVNFRDLKSHNRLRKNKIYVGQKLRIPRGKLKRRRWTYIVKRGDNLTMISRKFNVSIKNLIVYNNLKSQTIFPKQKIKIPYKS